VPKHKRSKKERLFELFDQGKTPSDEECKKIGLKGNTRYNYFSDWKVQRGLTDVQVPMGENPIAAAAEEQVTVSSVEGTPRPQPADTPPVRPAEPSPVFSSEELNAIENQDEEGDEEEEEPVEPEPVEPEPGAPADIPDDSGNGHGDEERLEAAETIAPVNTVRERREGKDGKEGKAALPRHIPTQGLKVTMEISVGTLTLYNFAHAQVKQVDPEAELTLGDFFDHCVERYYSDRGLRLGLVREGADGEQAVRSGNGD